MEVIVRYELTCRLTGEKFRGMEVGYCTTSNGTDIALLLLALLAHPAHAEPPAG